MSSSTRLTKEFQSKGKIIIDKVFYLKLDKVLFIKGIKVLLIKRLIGNYLVEFYLDMYFTSFYCHF
jgi:hypothetical protein